MDSHFLRGHFSRRGSKTTGGVFSSYSCLPFFSFIACIPLSIDELIDSAAHSSLGLSRSPNLSESTSLPAYTNPYIFPFLFFCLLTSLLSITDPLSHSSSLSVFFKVPSSSVASGIRVLNGFISVNNCELRVVKYRLHLRHKSLIKMLLNWFKLIQ